MDIVIDASVVIATIADEPEKPALVQLTRGAELLAPVSIHFEIGNALSAMFKRSRIRLDQALEALDIYQTIPIRFITVELSQSLEIAAARNIYAYDAYLIRCAEKHRCPLLTLDRALRVHAAEYGIQVLEVPK